MNARKHNLTNVLAVGVVLVILVSVGLFWLRWFCSVKRDNLLPLEARTLTIPLSSRLFGFPETNDPNGPVPPSVQARMAGRTLLAGCGAFQYVQTRVPMTPGSFVYRWDPKPDGLQVYFDSSLGQIVYKGTQLDQEAGGEHVLQHFTYYAGPDGIAETPDTKLGRFTSPVVDQWVLKPQILYDGALRRFFALDWPKRTVRKGPELPSEDTRKPIQIRALSKNPMAANVTIPPTRQEGNRRGSSIPWETYLLSMDRVLVLDVSGRIDLLDQQKLEYVGMAGVLPTPTTFLGYARPARPDDVAAYEVKPFTIWRGGANGERLYGGCAVASLSRDGFAMRLDVYDANGRRVAGNETSVPQYARNRNGNMGVQSIPSAAAAYDGLPGARNLTAAQFTLENLHPPVLLLLSYLTASHLEATTGYRSLFLLPGSFVAVIARDHDGRPVERLFLAVLCAFPAILFVLFLAWRVDRDCVRTGLSKDARTVWRVATIVFGLPVYITYRLTRPGVTLVTCQNCGQNRRPELEKCHRCGSPWVVPELIPPAWRVLDEGSPAALGWEGRKTQPGAAVLQDEAASEPQ